MGGGLRDVTLRAARRWMLVAAAVGVALRAAFGFLYWTGKPMTHDEREYLALARNLAEGRGFGYAPADETTAARQFGRAPGYPAFLALAGAGRGGYDSTPARVKLAQSALGGLTVLLIGLIALGASGPRAGVAAAAAAAVYPPLVWIPSYVLSEPLYSPLALASACVLQRAVAGDGVTPAAAGRIPALLALGAGVLAGIGILVRPALLFFLPLAILWLLGARRFAVALAFAAAAAAVVAPWTIRNLEAHGRVVLVASEGGITFWTGNHPLARGEGDLAANPALKRAELEFRQAHPGLDADELEPYYYRAAFRWIAAEPLAWGALLVRKLFYTIVPIGPSYTLHSTRYWAASVASYLLVLALAVRGFRHLWGSRSRPTAVLLLGASAVIANLVFFPQERFRIPVIDPVLIVTAAAAVRGPARGVFA